MERMSWNNLLSEVRRKDLVEPKEKVKPSSTKGDRSEAERDYDRIVFSSPTRRLANKTQVFPLDPNDTVRNRLTHSYEVSNLARSVGMSIAFTYASRVFGEDHEELNVKRKVPAILAAAALAHDLGNPPFGHQGEEAIKRWFSLKNSRAVTMHKDFLLFDGNPQTFRLLTRLQILNDDFGLNLTCGTLATLIKYPCFSDTIENYKYKKFGIFKSEKSIIKDVWEQTGLLEGVRHPLTFVVEACDDIAYSVLDAEDTVKKQFASFNDLIDHLSGSGDEIINSVVNDSIEDNKEFKKLGLSSSELNEVSMQKFRVYAIYHLITEVTNTFVSCIDSILTSSIEQDFKLLDESKANELCERLKSFDRRHGFMNPNVLQLELVGENTILETMDLLWNAITEKNEAFSRFAKSQLPESYRRVREKSDNDDSNYKNYQLLCDTISGISDSSLISLHEKLKALYRDSDQN